MSIFRKSVNYIVTHDLRKLSHHLQKHNYLEKIHSHIFQRYNALVTFGVEIEFYLTGNVKISELKRRLQLDIKKELGKNQFEITLPPSDSLTEYARQIKAVKQNTIDTASTIGAAVNFRAKPFTDQPSSSMHFNVGFGNNKNNSIDKEFFHIMAQALCHCMLDTCLIFLPHRLDYLRINEDIVQDFMAPVYVSFGPNNRTAAVRIPNRIPNRLEHRISSPSVDPYLAMSAILRSLLLGFEEPETVRYLEPTYGNSFDSQYSLKPLPQNQYDAMRQFKPNFFTTERFI